MLEDVSTAQVIVGSATVIAGAFAVYLSTNTPSAKAKRVGAVLPPGPKRAFLVGNAFNFPKIKWYKTFSHWAKEYGDVVYINLAGTSMVILNSLDVVRELADKRMNIYSNRPSTTMSKLSGLGFSTARLQPGPDFNEHRRVFRKAINPQVVAEYDGFIQTARNSLLQRLEGLSGDPYSAFIDTIGSLVTRMAYGEQFFRDHGRDLLDVNTKMITLAAWMLTKVWLIDIFPPLQYLPDWFPGATFKRFLRESNEVASRIRHQPFETIMPKIIDGTADDSILARYLDEGSFSRENIRDAVAIMYAAGLETTATALLNFLYCVTLYPEWQQKVHEEMDRVLGRGHLPTMEEIAKLPVFNAAWKEAVRWVPPAPLGVPHVSAIEDVWNGYYIPKGTVVWCNIGYAFGLALHDVPEVEQIHTPR